MAYIVPSYHAMSCSFEKVGLALAMIFSSACEEGAALLPTSDAASAIVDSGRDAAIAHDAGCKLCLPDIDAGGEPVLRQPGAPDAAAPRSCKSRKRPDCSKEPCRWADAQQRLPACVTQPLTPFFQQRCGRYDALVGQGTDSYSYYFYDRTGELVATGEIGIGGYQCAAIDPSFMAPEYEDCTLITPKCSISADEDAGMY